MCEGSDILLLSAVILEPTDSTPHTLRRMALTLGTYSRGTCTGRPIELVVAQPHGLDDRRLVAQALDRPAAIETLGARRLFPVRLGDASCTSSSLLLLQEELDVYVCVMCSPTWL